MKRNETPGLSAQALCRSLDRHLHRFSLNRIRAGKTNDAKSIVLRLRLVREENNRQIHRHPRSIKRLRPSKLEPMAGIRPKSSALVIKEREFCRLQAYTATTPTPHCHYSLLTVSLTVRANLKERLAKGIEPSCLLG